MKNNLLFDEQPIFANKTLARAIGLTEAIILQQINYWLDINKKTGKNFYEGRYWTYNSIRAWHENNFDYMSIDTVKRTFTKLEKQGYLITGNFNEDSRDKTKWYTIDEEKLLELSQEIERKKEEAKKQTLAENKDKLEGNSALPNALVQNAPMGNAGIEKHNLLQNNQTFLPNSIRAKCPNALVQNAPMHRGNLPQALPIDTTKDTTVVVNTNTISYSKPQNESYPQFDLQQIEEKTQQLQQTKTEYETTPIVLKDMDILLAILNYLIQGLQTLSLAPILLTNVSYLSMNAIFSVCEAISNKRENQEMIVDFAAYVTAALIEQIQFAQRNQRLE